MAEITGTLHLNTSTKDCWNYLIPLVILMAALAGSKQKSNIPSFYEPKMPIVMASFRSRPAVNNFPSARSMTTRASGMRLMLLKTCPISLKKAGFMALRALGLSIVTLIMVPDSSYSTFKVSYDIKILLKQKFYINKFFFILFFKHLIFPTKSLKLEGF